MSLNRNFTQGGIAQALPGAARNLCIEGGRVAGAGDSDGLDLFVVDFGGRV
jgi:hypothetical protein